jgi:hypothetical protein
VIGIGLGEFLIEYILVTVASAEGNFSKLKLLKNCFTSIMLQERLSDLAICSIEKDILDKKLISILFL